jgi:hypothetical protein
LIKEDTGLQRLRLHLRGLPLGGQQRLLRGDHLG